jgi:hypothetical protein
MNKVGMTTSERKNVVPTQITKPNMKIVRNTVVMLANFSLPPGVLVCDANGLESKSGS